MSDINLISFIQKNQKLIELIVKLKDDRDSPLKNTGDYVEEFMQLYEIGWRHSYSILTQYFFGKYRKSRSIRGKPYRFNR